MKMWIQSYSGKAVTPLDLKEDQVSLDDIAHVLSQKVRFTGHLRDPGYSVAQHCILGAQAIHPQYALAFLLHDASEVYLPDIASPIKPAIHVVRPQGGVWTWAELERHHADVILRALGLSEIRTLLDSDEVHEMDLRMLMTEKRDLMGPGPKWEFDAKPLDIRISVWPAETAKTEFQKMFVALRARG